MKKEDYQILNMFNKARFKILNFIVFLGIPFMVISENFVLDFNPYKEIMIGSPLFIEMKPVEGGTFQMGSDLGERGRNENEGLVRNIVVEDFWMSVFEITWDQYQLFLYREIDNIKDPNQGEVKVNIDGVSGATMPYVNFNKPGHPVVTITQYAASTFCKWLTAKTGRFYRLPTEAEWEYASKAGTNSAFSFGEHKEKLGQYAWFSENSHGTFHKPGKKLPNPWGFYDIHGNVAEWVVDAYTKPEYTQETVLNPVVFPKTLYPRVVRGGSWKDDASHLRSAARSYSNKSWKKRDPQLPKSLWWHTDATHVGFRIVRPKKTPSMKEMEKYWATPIEEY